MWHLVTNGRWWGRWGTKVLLWGCHHVVRVGHYRRLSRIVSRVVVGGLTRNQSAGMGLPRGRRVVLNWHGDEIAVFSSSYCCYAECLRPHGRGWRRSVMWVLWRWLTVGVMWAVLQGVGEVNMVLR